MSFEETLDPDSRTISLFENGRYYAYSIVSDCHSEDELYNRVLDWIEQLNNIKIPEYFQDKGKMSNAELKSIARSVSSWTYQRRQDFRKYNVGAMGLETMRGQEWTPEEYAAEVKHRQSLSANRTNEIRRESTREKIVAAIGRCLAEGRKVTVSAISRSAGVDRSTIYKYHRDLIVAA